MCFHLIYDSVANVTENHINFFVRRFAFLHLYLVILERLTTQNDPNDL